jgi:hypothetical protein
MRFEVRRTERPGKILFLLGPRAFFLDPVVLVVPARFELAFSA